MKKLAYAVVPALLIAAFVYAQPGPNPCGNNNCTVTTLTATKTTGGTINLRGDAGICFGNGTCMNAAASGSGGGAGPWIDGGVGNGIYYNSTVEFDFGTSTPPGNAVPDQAYAVWSVGDIWQLEAGKGLADHTYRTLDLYAVGDSYDGGVGVVSVNTGSRFAIVRPTGLPMSFAGDAGILWGDGTGLAPITAGGIRWYINSTVDGLVVDSPDALSGNTLWLKHNGSDIFHVDRYGDISAQGSMQLAGGEFRTNPVVGGNAFTSQTEGAFFCKDNNCYTKDYSDPTTHDYVIQSASQGVTIRNIVDGGALWRFGDAGMQYPDNTFSATAGASSGLVQWDAQATTTPNVGSALSSYNSTSITGFWFHVDTTSGNQLQLVADGGAQASDKTAGFITSDTLPSADYRVRSMIQLCASTLTSSCDRFAVIARASQSGGALTAYYFTISGFTGTTAATVGLYKVVADSFTAIGPTAVTLATYLPGIAAGDYVAVDLEVHGGNIRGFINGRLVASGRDTAISAAGGGGVVIQPAVGSSTMAVINVPFFGLLPYAPFNY